eukprot:scaffold133895_cov34-Tisochrysis_lutea.AAC.2
MSSADDPHWSPTCSFEYSSAFVPVVGVASVIELGSVHVKPACASGHPVNRGRCLSQMLRPHFGWGPSTGLPAWIVRLSRSP